MDLPAASEWAAAGLLSFVGRGVGLAGALAVASLFRPDFVEVRGCVLLPWNFTQAGFDEWWNSLDGDRSRIEGVINHIHLWDYFEAGEDQQAKEALVSLGQLVADSWRSALADAYPDALFTVTYSDDPEDYGPTVTFFSSPHAD